MAHLTTILVYPIKGLDPVAVDSALIDTVGGLAFDRNYALFSRDGAYVNGRRNPRIHEIRSTYDLPQRTVTLHTAESEPEAFHLDTDHDALEAWFTAHFDEPVTFNRANANYNDSAGGLSHWKKTTHGPSLISQGTLDEVASWFDDISPAEMRRRFRPNLIVDDTLAFWEDHLYGDEDHLVKFTIGDVTLHGLRPIPRCAVPTKHPTSGDRTTRFIERFIERREATFPDWTDPGLLKKHGTRERTHYYFLATVTRIPPAHYGAELTTGEDLEIIGEAPLLTEL